MVAPHMNSPSDTQLLQATDVAPQSGSNYPEPFASRMGVGDWRSLGDAFGLTQFGVNLETLQPGAQSALRHWHTLSDEFVYMLSGELTLRTNAGEFAMRPGMCMGFKAGDKNAHHLVNRSAAAASFIVLGSRMAGDNAFYPDDDFAWFHTEAGKRKVHKDGTAFEAE
jgi:uncharacterized cupin superfamily protein